MNAGTEELSVGAMVAGMLVLGTLGCSLLMMAFWLVRYLQFGYVLPDANRGYLRVPLAGTIVGIIVGLLLAMLATLVSIMPVPAEEFATANQKMTPDMMWGPILHTLLMDLILFGIFGSVVYAFSFQSRVRGPSVLFPEVSGQSAAAAPLLAAEPDQPSRADVLPAVPSVTNPYGASDSPDHYSYLSAPSADSIAAPRDPGERFSFLREVRFAGEVFLASYFPTTVFRFIIIILISAITGEQPDQHPFLEMMKEGIGLPLLVMIFLMAVILAPVVEELFYRIIILGGLCQKGSVHIGMIISCLLFSFAHGFPDSLALLPLAAALGYTYVRRQSYVTVMLVHFFFNAFNMVIAGVGLL